MSNPLLDLSIAVTIGAIALLGTMTVLPRPKPEPPPPIEQPCDPKQTECPIGPAVTIRAEPKSDEQRVREIERDVAQIAREQKQLAEDIKALAIAQGQKESE